VLVPTFGQLGEPHGGIGRPDLPQLLQHRGQRRAAHHLEIGRVALRRVLGGLPQGIRGGLGGDTGGERPGHGQPQPGQLPARPQRLAEPGEQRLAAKAGLVEAARVQQR
jgi:hypothetical protein